MVALYKIKTQTIMTTTTLNAPEATTTKWALDPTHSELGFKIKHLMISTVTGSFTDFTVETETTTDDFSDAVINAEVAVASINTNNSMRDEHLRTADFFEGEAFPKILFRSTTFEKLEDGSYNLTGDLTIRNIVKPVTLSVEYNGIAKDPWGNIKAGFAFEGKINRKDFGINYNAALETGGVLLSEEVKIFGEIQLVKQL
jgi:polyisoprenoid-binding protein YceI